MPDANPTPTLQQEPQLLPALPDPFCPDPEWATGTSDRWTLVEIKGGVELSKLELNKRPCWLMGRAADQVHIPMQHPSISRCHARIAFDKTGVPWLRDLKSTHGVFVNKKRLPPESIGLDTDTTRTSTRKGSRGVVLYPGDVIQLGASTRLYCLEGPEQFQRGRIRIPPAKPKVVQQPQQQPVEEEDTSSNATETTQQQEEEEAQDTGVSWGISMDEAADHQEEESVDEAMKRQHALEQVPEKHRKAWEKIQSLKYKLQNIQTENERIRRKGELTQGQENQLKRNAEREQQLSEQILEREKELYDKINPDRAKTKKRRHHHHHHPHDAEDDDVDDFYDRTKDSNSGNSPGDGETEESLLAKWKELQSQHKRKEVLVERAKHKTSSLQQRLDRLRAAGDDEAFFAQNDLDLAQDQLNKLQAGQHTIEKDLEETKRLLKIVNPNLVLEEPEKGLPSSTIADGAIMPPPMLPPPMRKPAAAPASTESKESMMPPPMMPPPKRKRTVGPSPPAPSSPTPPAAAAPPPSSEATQDNKSSSSAAQSSSKGKVKGPARGPPTKAPLGTLAALTAVTSKGGPSTQQQHQQDTLSHKAPSKQSTSKQPATAIDLKKDEWRAPKDQDGSGITKLNAKFAGRY